MTTLVAVSWTMPPIVLPRSIQIARAMKALGRLGWQTEVISTPIAASGGANIDDAFARLYQDTYLQTYVEYREQVEASSYWRRLRRKFSPPEHIDEANWIERAAAAVVRRRDQRRCDVLVTFAQPWIDHMVGLEVRRRRRGIPWVAHFSDPWTDSPYYDQSIPEIASKMEVWRDQERRIISGADVVIFVTSQTADLVMRKYPEEWRQKVRIVPHGFDRDAVAGPASGATSQALRIVYTGNIYAGTRHPLNLFEALAEINQTQSLAGRVQLDFFGYCPPDVVERAKALGLEPIMAFHGTIGYIDSLRRLAEGDLLLLIDAPSDVSVFLPSKIVDYLMLGKPILALTPSNGASKDVLSPLGHIVVAPDDRPAMVEALTRALAAHAAGRPLATINNAGADEFDIRNTTRRLDKALREAIAIGARR